VGTKVSAEPKIKKRKDHCPGKIAKIGGEGEGKNKGRKEAATGSFP